MSRAAPNYREFLHWLVTNIPGDDFSKGHIIAEYAGVGPPEHMGLHRIVYTVYKQPGHLDFSEQHTGPRTLGMRMKFLQKKFSQKYNMGDPVAGNMFVSKFDESVPHLIHEFMTG